MHDLPVLGPDDGEPRYVIHRSAATTFHDLNVRRAGLGLGPLHPASSLTFLAREVRSIEAAAVRAWRRDHHLVAVPTGRAAPRRASSGGGGWRC